jgi:ribosome maturation factor RimP
MITEAIKSIIVSKCAGLGFELFDLKLYQAGSRAVLRVTIDRAAGVTVGDCEMVSNELSVVLDVEQFLEGRPFTLEVSSPGIDRPLKTERDFKRAIGRFVILQMCGNGLIECEIGEATVSLPVAMIASGKEELQFK